MKHRYPNMDLSWITLRNACMAMALFALLQGCASDGPKTADSFNKAADNSRKVETSRAANHGASVSSEAKADFEAAMQFVNTEEYEKAIELLNKVVKAEPQNAVASINLALVYKKQGALKQAEDSLKAALAAEPENPVANNEYALLYRKTGRFAEARALYEKTLEKYPHFTMVHKNLGILCDLYLKDYECALKHYTIYSSVEQDDKSAKIWIADLQKRTGK